MPGILIQANSYDSIRITRDVRDGGAVQLPAALVLAADAVLRELVMDTAAVLVVEVEPQPDGTERWCAWLHGKVGRGVTPWAAIKELAQALEGNG